MEDSKKLVVKFEVTCEIDSSNVDGDSLEEKLESWKHDVDSTLYDATCHWGEVWTNIECKNADIEDYE